MMIRKRMNSCDTLYCCCGYDEMKKRQALYKKGKEYRKRREEIMKYLYISTDARGMTGNY